MESKIKKKSWEVYPHATSGTSTAKRSAFRKGAEWMESELKSTHISEAKAVEARIKSCRYYLEDGDCFINHHDDDSPFDNCIGRDCFHVQCFLAALRK